MDEEKDDGAAPLTAGEGTLIEQPHQQQRHNSSNNTSKNRGGTAAHARKEIKMMVTLSLGKEDEMKKMMLVS